jgi:hypothetical protein
MAGSKPAFPWPMPPARPSRIVRGHHTHLISYIKKLGQNRFNVFFCDLRISMRSVLKNDVAPAAASPAEAALEARGLGAAPDIYHDRPID